MFVASTSSNPSLILEIEKESPYPSILEAQKEYPYPSHNFATNIVTVKLSGKAKYSLWKTQMLCLLWSHNMHGFIDGTFQCPSKGNRKAKDEDMNAWFRSDSLVKGWILDSLSEELAIIVVNRLESTRGNTDFTAKDVWEALQHKYCPLPLKEAAEAKSQDGPSDENYGIDIPTVYKRCLRGIWHPETVITPVHKITNNGNTALHVAIGSSTKNHNFLVKLLEMVGDEELDVQNSDGSTPLHVAAIVGNTGAAKILLEKKRDLLFATDKEGHTPLAISLSNMHIETSKCLLEHIRKEENGKVFSGTMMNFSFMLYHLRIGSLQGSC